MTIWTIRISGPAPEQVSDYLAQALLAFGRQQTDEGIACTIIGQEALSLSKAVIEAVGSAEHNGHDAQCTTPFSVVATGFDRETMSFEALLFRSTTLLGRYVFMECGNPGPHVDVVYDHERFGPAFAFIANGYSDACRFAQDGPWDRSIALTHALKQTGG